MQYEFSIRTLRAQPTLSIRGRTSLEKLPATIGEFLTEVWNHLQAQGVRPTGQPYTRYHGFSGEVIDLEAGMPIEAAVPGRGRTQAGELPGGEVAVTTHLGSYDGLVSAGEALAAWVAAQGREPAGPNWEVYVTDPGSQPDPAHWRTDVYKPLKAAPARG